MIWYVRVVLPSKLNLSVLLFQVPGLRIIKLEEDMAKYKPETYDLSESGLTTFVQKFLDGKLKQHLLSQDLPEDWDKEPVKVRILIILVLSFVMAQSNR